MAGIHEQIEAILASGLFDGEWYCKQYPDVSLTPLNPVEHFVRIGGILGRNPGPLFDTKFYLHDNPDVAAAGLNPVYHYVITGRMEGRRPRQSLPTALQQDPVVHSRTSKTSSLKETPASTIANDGEASPSTELTRPVVLISGEATDRPGFVYRVERYADAFRKAGEAVIIIPRERLQLQRDVIKAAKVVYIWRANWRADIEDAVNSARESGALVIFDLDDLMIRPELATAEYIDAIRFNQSDPEKVRKHYSDMRSTMLACDISTASTHELAWHMRFSPPRKPTYVLPNGFARDTYVFSRVHARAKARATDPVIRIGYASGSRTHQADFRLCAAAVADVLRSRKNCKLVLFRRNELATLDPIEFPELQGLDDQFEWRSFVEHRKLPAEVARFDINLAPLEHGNPFCEAKSELKFFEAAIADVPTIASPTGPFRRAILHGETGYLADTPEEWRNALFALVDDPRGRRHMGREAHRRAMWPWGPVRRTEIARSFLDQLTPGRAASRAMHYEAQEFQKFIPAVPIEGHRTIFDHDKGRTSQITVIIPLFNYSRFIEEALDSVFRQTAPEIDLIVVDDLSTDNSLELTKQWMATHHARFNRTLLVQHITNQGLGASRNTAFDLADTLHVMALDADNRLLPRCCAVLFEAMEREGAAFAYPVIRQFGDASRLIGVEEFLPANLIPGNYIDAMAMISKEAWAAVGGFATHRMGWQDYDLWCRFTERGFHGIQVPAVLAEYRVHGGSMLRTATDKSKNKSALSDHMEVEHPWLSLLAERRGHHFK